MEINSAGAVLLMLVAVVAAGFGAYFLFKRCMFSRSKSDAVAAKHGEMGKKEYTNMIKRRYEQAGRNTHFVGFLVEINEGKLLRERLGEKNYRAAVNELMGRMLRLLPRGVRLCGIEPDTVAAFAEDVLDDAQLNDLCTFLLIEGAKPITLPNKETVNLDLNIGAAVYNALSPTYDRFERNLEVALVAARRKGLNGFAVYSSSLMAESGDEYKYYREIKHALEADEFTMYYQPMFDLAGTEPFAYEALLRWNNKSLGVLSPAKFLDIVEQSGDIGWIGIWTFERVLIARQAYLEKYPDKQTVFSLNLSGKQLDNPSLAEDFLRIKKKYEKVAAGSICLEVSEKALRRISKEAKENLDKLADAGFKIAIDNFGMDAGALKLLDTLRFDWIKLDSGFIDCAKDDFLYEGVSGTLMAYAKRKNFIVIAEGIEDNVSLEFVKSKGIAFGQGHYYGRPLPASDYKLF